MPIDFKELLRKPALEAKKPEALPAGDYPGIITGHEFGDNNKNKTPYIRMAVKLTGWPDDVEESEREGVDLSKRTLRRDYYLTDDAMWRLDELIRDCGLGGNGETYEELIPALTGSTVLVEVQQYLNQKTNETGNQIGKLVAN